MKKFLNVVIIVLLIGSIGFNIFLILNNIKTTKKYDDAVIENESLAQEKSELKSDLIGAEGRFNVLQEKYDELYDNYDVLLDFYNENYVPEPEEPKIFLFAIFPTNCTIEAERCFWWGTYDTKYPWFPMDPGACGFYRNRG